MDNKVVWEPGYDSLDFVESGYDFVDFVELGFDFVNFVEFSLWFYWLSGA
jgi:hypothetical protein